MASRSWDGHGNNIISQVMTYLGAHHNFQKTTSSDFRPPNFAQQGLNFSLATLPNTTDYPIAAQFREFFDFVNDRVDVYRSEMLPLIWPVLLRMLCGVLERRTRPEASPVVNTTASTAESAHGTAVALLDAYAACGLPLPPEFNTVRNDLAAIQSRGFSAARINPPTVVVRISQLAVDALNEFLSSRGATAVLAALNDRIKLEIHAGLGAFPGRRPYARPRSGRILGHICAPTTLDAHLASSSVARDLADLPTSPNGYHSHLLTMLREGPVPSARVGEAGAAALEMHDSVEAAASVSIVLETVYAPAAADVTSVALCVASSERDLAAVAAAAADGTTAQLDSALDHATSAWVFAANTDGLVRGWSLRAGGADGSAPDRTFCGHRGGVMAVDVDVTGRWVLTGGEDGYVNLFDTRTAQSMAEYIGHGEFAVWAAQFCPLAPSRILSGGAIRAALLHDTTSTAPARVLSGHVADVTSVAWHPTNPRICATGCADRTVRIWDLADARPVMQYDLLPDGVQSIAFSSCGTQLAMGSESGSLCVTNIVSDRQVFMQRPPTVPTEFDTPVNCLSWAPGSDVVAAGYASPAVGVGIWRCNAFDDDAFVASYPTRAVPVLAVKYLASGLVQAAGPQAFIAPA